MRSFASRLLNRAAAGPRTRASEEVWTIPPGHRVYAIGDIHGRLDLLQRLLVAIERDDRARAAARTIRVFLGDLVDRGADSRGVVELLMQAAADGDCVFLAGNHDEIFARAVAGEREAAARLDRMGGRETALSYGIGADEYDQGSFDDLARLLNERVPPEHAAFLRAFRDWYQLGDYIFVHAGIRPGRAMHEQVSEDLRWIRSGFLDYAQGHGAMIVHGHTVTAEPDFRSNRIGIDTGAFRSGKLTALGLEKTDRWLLAT